MWIFRTVCNSLFGAVSFKGGQGTNLTTKPTVYQFTLRKGRTVEEINVI